MKNIRSISITKPQAEFLNEHSYISLSQICQNAIEKQMEEINKSATHKENEYLRERLKGVVEKLQQTIKYIDRKGLMDEYLKEVE